MLAKGDAAGALASYRAAIAIVERLAKQDPENADLQRGIHVSHNKIGDRLRVQGDKTGALTSFRAALAIAERLTERDPDNTLWQRDLAVTHIEFSNVLLRRCIKTAAGRGEPAQARFSLQAGPWLGTWSTTSFGQSSSPCYPSTPRANGEGGHVHPTG